MAAAGSGAVVAAEATEPPAVASFYGTVEIDGTPAEPGVTVEAEIDGEVRGSIAVDEAGQYGGPGLDEEKLLVEGNESEADETVTFYVDGPGFDRTRAGSTTFEPHDLAAVNLTAEVDRPAPAELTLKLDDETIVAGRQTHLSVVAVHENGTRVNVTNESTIESADAGVATVAGDTVVAQGAGTVQLDAWYAGEQATATLVVESEADGGSGGGLGGRDDIEIDPDSTDATAGAFAIEALEVPDEVSVGDSLQIESTVANGGEAAASPTVTVSIDGDTVHEEVVELEAGTDTAVQASSMVEGAGTLTVRVSIGDETASESVRAVEAGEGNEEHESTGQTEAGDATDTVASGTGSAETGDDGAGAATGPDSADKMPIFAIVAGGIVCVFGLVGLRWFRDRE